MTDPEQGDFEMVCCPIRLSDSEVPVDNAPTLGEHSRSIYGELGIDDEEFDRLREEKAI